ncbi:hypothetical protein SAMN05216404_12132 [Nitrosospira multiformis]|uniref:Uncharacterized protein n=1 Tax=Nitrosospira multiformis TaxID=1231 RepID=A0A1H8PMH8_9PROT|nr:hypothetical protein SAMN05216404_12132 [Nitrosospira multiformis]
MLISRRRIPYLVAFLLLLSILTPYSATAQDNELECRRDRNDCFQACRQSDPGGTGDCYRVNCLQNYRDCIQKQSRAGEKHQLPTSGAKHTSSTPTPSTLSLQTESEPVGIQTSLRPNITLRVMVENAKAKILIPTATDWCGQTVTLALLTRKQEDYFGRDYRDMFGAEPEVITELKRTCPQARTINFYGLFGTGNGNGTDEIFDAPVWYYFQASEKYDWHVEDWLERRRSGEMSPVFTITQDKAPLREPNLPTRDRQLIQELYTLLTDVEANTSSLKFEQFQKVTIKEFTPRLRELAASALAQYDRLPSQGRLRAEALEELDEGAGGAALVLAWRWLRIPDKKRSAPITLGMMLENEQERMSWQNAFYTTDPVDTVFQRLGQHFGSIRAYNPPSKARIDTSALKAYISAKPASKSSKRGAAPVVNSTAPSTITYYFGTPGMIAAARIGADVGRGVGEAASILVAAYMKSQLQDTQVRKARERFWSCHYQRCPEYAQVYMEYSEALLQKDVLYFNGYVAAKALPLMQNGFLQKIGSPGLGYIDGGIIHGCWGDYETAAKKLMEKVIAAQQDEAVRSEDSMVGFLQSDSFQRWQQCRDSAEMAMRPRGEFFR